MMFSRISSAVLSLNDTKTGASAFMSALSFSVVSSEVAFVDSAVVSVTTSVVASAVVVSCRSVRLYRKKAVA